MKKYNTIGCCGIDCGLCPRFQTKADSACPGCGGPDFKLKHPSCGFLTCCVNKKRLEVCAECNDYPCSRFDAEKQGYDSFVTHKKVFPNLDFIHASGIESFIKQQKQRIEILEYFLENYDEGRSKSYFCLSCALLPLNALLETHRNTIKSDGLLNKKEKNKVLKDILQKAADNLKIELKLNKKK